MFKANHAAQRDNYGVCVDEHQGRSPNVRSQSPRILPTPHFFNYTYFLFRNYLSHLSMYELSYIYWGSLGTFICYFS